MGCLYGANLARIGESVIMLDVWQEHVDRMQKDGIQMDGLHGSFTGPVAATTQPACAPKSDIALILSTPIQRVKQRLRPRFS